MSKLELLKLLQQYGDETNIADFTPDELFDLLQEMSHGEMPLTKDAFKEKYFAYYDDVKDKSLKNQDW